MNFKQREQIKLQKGIRKRVGDNPLYLSIDIDVLDPAFAPGTGTPEIAGNDYKRNGKCLKRDLSGLNLVSADVVEVSPAYDHAEVTSLSSCNNCLRAYKSICKIIKKGYVIRNVR
jgi:agmatinase